MSGSRGADADDGKRLPLLEHVNELAHRTLYPVAVTAALFVMFFMFGPSSVDVGDFRLPILEPSLIHSFSAMVFRTMVDHLLPKGMELINVGAMDVLKADLYASALLAAIFSMPAWIYEIGAFLSPGLKANEKRMLALSAGPAALLFAGGVAFSYYLVLPFMYRFAYYLALGFGVTPSMSVSSFMWTSVAIMIAMGASFELPLGMAALSYLGIVEPETWMRGWRYGVVAAFFIALLISPGATGGIIETVIGITLSALYFAGALLARYLRRRRVRAGRDGDGI